MTTAISPSDEVDAPSWAIRPELPIDLDQIHELHRDVFHRPQEAELVDAVRSGPTFVPELSLVAATPDGSILGHVMLSQVEFHPDEGEPARQDVLALAPLAVMPAHEGHGIGSALMKEALAAADARDEPFVVALGSVAFYERFGFVPATEFGIQGPHEEAGDAFQVRPRPGGEQLVAGAIVYPPMFEGL